MTSWMTVADSVTQSLPPSVTGWAYGEVIEDCTRERVQVARGKIEDALEGMDPMEFGQKMLELLSTWPQPVGWNAVLAMSGYVDAIGALPADLFAVARTQVLATAKRLPSPAEILAPVKLEWDKRKARHAYLAWVLRKATFRSPDTGPKPTPEQMEAIKAELAAKWASCRPLSRMP